MNTNDLTPEPKAPYAATLEEYLALADYEIHAELIDGFVYEKPAENWAHNQTTTGLFFQLRSQLPKDETGRIALSVVSIQCGSNVYEPDLAYFTKLQVKQVVPDQILMPCPIWVVEVLSAASEKLDRGQKLQDYAAYGVEEYLIIDPIKQMLEQYLNQDGQFQKVAHLARNDRYASQTITGFEIELELIFA